MVLDCLHVGVGPISPALNNVSVVAAMAETFTSPAWELLDALAILRERKVSLGDGHEPIGWCPPWAAAAIRRCVIDRSGDLWPNLRAAVRLVRAASLAEPRGYVHFMYGSVRALSGPRFRAGFHAARDRRRVPATGLEIGPQAVRLLETEMLARTGAGIDGFEITYAQMPRLVALLDVLHNTLGYDKVAELLEPVTTAGRPALAADDIAKVLRSAFHGWLAPRLDSPRHRQQAKLIFAFLRTTAGPEPGLGTPAGAGPDRSVVPAPEHVTDQSIVEFWKLRAKHWHGRGKSESTRKSAQDEGFRAYRATAQAMLRYRWCLRDAAVMFEAISKENFDRAVEGMRAPDVEPEISLLGRQSLPTDAAEAWLSPITQLTTPPADRIKWLNAKERDWLENYLGKAEPELEQEQASEPKEEHIGSGLDGGRRFDLCFARTLLRADVFGPVQGVLTARTRQLKDPQWMLTQDQIASAFAKVDAGSYAQTASRYREIEAQVRLEARAAVDILAHVDPGQFAILVKALAGLELGREFQETLDAHEAEHDNAKVISLQAVKAGQPRSATAAILANDEAMANEKLAELLASAKKARASVHRAGFRKEDESNPEWAKAFAVSASGLAALLAELRRLCAHLEDSPCLVMGDDQETFRQTFHLLYA